MSKLFQNYKRTELEFVKAEGAYLFDQDGKKYLDFSSGIGVTNLGFHPQVKAALAQQLEAIWHSPNLYQSSLQEEVAEKLIGTYDYLAFFCNSGAEANEAAIKLARKASGKQEIISFIDSFHAGPSEPCLPQVRTKSRRALATWFHILAMQTTTT